MSEGIDVKSFLPIALIALLGLLAESPLFADTVSYRSGAARPLEMEATIQKVENGELVFVSRQSGREVRKGLDQVVTIRAADEPTFSAAEDAFAAGKWDVAATSYQKALGITQKEWVKDRSVMRLVEAAAKSGQFASSVSAFVEMAKRDPANAAKHRPAIPKDKPDQLAAPAAEVERALADSKLKAPSAQLLRSFVIDLYLAKGDAAGAERILKMPGAADLSRDGDARIRAGLRLSQAKAAMASKDYPRAIEAIESARAAFVEPDQQAEALYLLAEARSAGAKDDKSLQDAAIAYMRVVAHFQNKPGSPNVTESLLKAAAIEERLNQPAEAIALYTQVANDPRLKGSPAAAEAAKNLQRLSRGRTS